ncbi:MAG TPA: hypothetical protein VIU63_03135 [Nitrospira sp.]
MVEEGTGADVEEDGAGDRMKNEIPVKQVVAVSLLSCMAMVSVDGRAAEPAGVRSHAEQSFDRLKQQGEQKDSLKPAGPAQAPMAERNSYSADRYLIGKGQGDLTKGAIVCQRVSELSARTDLAKQIRILVKEHMVDRVREKTGRDTEQDIEVTREEIVQEYLLGVKIVDRRIDDANKTCSATAVMSKSQIQPKPAPEHAEPLPTGVH